MIRQLARCPYCGTCEIALDDSPSLVFDPDGSAEPCPHLAWVEGRFSEWEHTEHGTNRIIGSGEFRWDPPTRGAAERTADLLPYLKELLESGPGWPFAPQVPFSIQTLSGEVTAKAPDGKVYPKWDVDGWGIFAEDPAAFWAALPECAARQNAALDVQGGEPGA
jgi:hypothetical protein